MDDWFMHNSEALRSQNQKPNQLRPIMARKARVVAVGVPHPVTQRGNHRQDVFLTDDDRRYYLSVLRDRAQQAGLRLLGYC